MSLFIEIIASIFCFFFILSLRVESHGYVVGPFTARNVARSNYCPQCANGPSPCGGGENGQWETSTDVDLVSGPWSTIPKKVQAGQVFELEIRLTAAHQGHFVLDLCRPSGDRITHECFSRRLLRDPTDNRYAPYLPSAPSAFFFTQNTCATKENQMGRFIMPADFGDCEHCILRWNWQTANSCSSHPASGPNPAKEITDWRRGSCMAATTSFLPCGTDCPNHSCSNESFKNCMDIKIVGGAGPTPGPSTSTTSSTSSTSSRSSTATTSTTSPSAASISTTLGWCDPSTSSTSSTSTTSTSPGSPGNAWPGCDMARPLPGSGLSNAHCKSYCLQLVKEDGPNAIGIWPGCGLGSTDPTILKPCLNFFRCYMD